MGGATAHPTPLILEPTLTGRRESTQAELSASARTDIPACDGHVRFGSKADICAAKSHVRFTPNSDIDCVFRHVCFGPIADISAR
jgi:hypothetical protein